MFCDGAMASRRILLILAFYCYAAFADLVVKPKDTESKVGATTFLNCSTKIVAEEVFWFHYQVGSKDRKLVYGYGQFYVPYQGRFELEKESHPDQSAYNLVIRSVIPQDSGIYECQDGAGHGEQSPQVDMVVLDDDPLCQSDMRHGSVVGPNSCGLPTENLDLTCKVKFHGNQPPIMAWFKDKSNQPITEHITQSVSGDSITYNLTFEADPSIDGSHFECRTSRSPTTQYQCTSEVVTVVGSKSLMIAIICLAILSVFLLIGGFFVVLKARKYKGKKPIGKTKECLELLNSQTNQTEPYALLAKENEELQAENKRLQGKVCRLEQITYTSDKTDKPSEAKFIQNIKAKHGSAISGITLLRNQLFVVHENYSGIEVFDSMTFSLERTLNIKGLLNPLDIASSDSSELGDHLYVVDLHSNKPIEFPTVLKNDDNFPNVIEKNLIQDHFDNEKKDSLPILAQNDQSNKNQDGVSPNEESKDPKEDGAGGQRTANAQNASTINEEEQKSSQNPGKYPSNDIDSNAPLPEALEDPIENSSNDGERNLPKAGEKENSSRNIDKKSQSKDGKIEKSKQNSKSEKSKSNEKNKSQQETLSDHPKDEKESIVDVGDEQLQINKLQFMNYQSRCFVMPISVTGLSLEDPWPVDDIDCRVSVYDRNVVVLQCEKRQIFVHSLTGKVLCVVKLSPSDGFGRLFCAIQVAETIFAVTHCTPISKSHYLSIIDTNGKAKFSVEKINTPMCLVENHRKQLLLADSGNYRILQFDPTLEKHLEIISKQPNIKDLISKEPKFNRLTKNANNLEHLPWRIALDDANARLFVALRDRGIGVSKNEGISVFNIT